MSEDEIEEYGDLYINSYDKKIPRWLKFAYVILPIWGLIWFYLYWNGSEGELDRGYWHQLEKAAKTTYEEQN